MDPFIIAQTIDLAGENPAKTYRQPLAAGDSAAHRWEVRVVRGGQAADLTGCTAAVMARREGEDSSPTVRQTAQIAGNVASAEFIPEVYALGGRLLAVMVISDASGRVVTSAALRMQGKQYTTDSISDPEGTIPSLDALLARYNDLLSATQEAQAATADARAAAEETQAALSDAQTALTDAQHAVSAAQGALTTAQTAADTAGAAAVKIDNMTVSATPVSTGTATAELSTVDGHYHLALGLPKGDTGATPQISVQVQTGAAGSEASVSVSGTAEEPVIHLTIPRGDTGRIENLTINGKPVESGTITLTAADLGAASAESVNQLKDDKLDKTATAADSAKLGGKAPEYYIQPRNLLDNSDFRNPVNQRGVTSYSGTGYKGYTIDRWRLHFGGSTGQLDVTPSGIKFTLQDDNAYFDEMLDLDTSKTYTFAAMVNGELSLTSGVPDNNVNNGVIILAKSDGGYLRAGFCKKGEETIVTWAALYEGAYTADTLPPYVPKGYAAELAECRLYYRPQQMYCLYCYSGGYAVGINFEPMRSGVIPTPVNAKAQTMTGDDVAGKTTIFVTQIDRVSYVANPNFAYGNYYRVFSEFSSDL